MILEGKTVVVCGVGPGLGREVAHAALRDGANVVIGARNEERLEGIAKELDPTGKRIASIAVDITDAERCANFLDEGAKRFDGVDAVVQVAAFDTQFGTLATTTEEEWQTCLNANVIGTMRIAKAALPHLKSRGGGSLVLVGSQSMWLSPPMPQLAYASSKGALVSSMYHLAEELGPDKIRVNMVIPTWMWGPPVELYMNWQAKERGITVEEAKAEVVSGMPLGEMPADEDVAEAVVFFCSDRSRMITGETLMVNAGEFLRD